jgi:hypothetical protein
MTFHAIRTFSSGLSFSFQADRATWPFGKCKHAHREIFGDQSWGALNRTKPLPKSFAPLGIGFSGSSKSGNMALSALIYTFPTHVAKGWHKDGDEIKSPQRGYLLSTSWSIAMNILRAQAE